MKRLSVLVAVLVAAAISVNVAQSDDPNVNNYTPAQIQQMSSIPGNAQSVPIIGDSITQANLNVYTASLPSDQGNSVEGIAPKSGDGNICWYIDDDRMSDQWGIWPFQQKLIEHRQWCAKNYGGPQTYRASQIHLWTTLCSSSDRYTTKISGGNGYTYTTVESGASFSCPTPIPWWSYHYDRWMRYWCNTRGECRFVGQS